MTLLQIFTAGLFSLSTSLLAVAPGFYAGAAAVDITPQKLPSVISGNFFERKAATIVDRLHVRCLVLDDGKTKIGFAVVDTCMMTRELIDEAKQLAISLQTRLRLMPDLIPVLLFGKLPLKMPRLLLGRTHNIKIWLP